MPIKLAWSLLKQTVNAWIDDNAASMGAALAYYSVFSIAPSLLIIIAVTGWVFGAEAARGEILVQLQGFIGKESATLIEELIKNANKQDKSAAITLIGIIGLLIGATTVFSELQNALNRIWHAPAKVKASGIIRLLRAQLLSFGAILCIALLLMLSLLISAALALFGNWWGPVLGGWEIVVLSVNFLLSFAFITLLFALIYKFLPRITVAWRDVWIGAAFASLLFTLGKLIIGLYIGKSSVTSAFGAAGSLAALLLWVYYSAQILLFGAEFTWVYAHTLGSKKSVEPLPSAEIPPNRSDLKHLSTDAATHSDH